MQTELVFYCNAATPLMGTVPSNPWAFPGSALSASAKRLYPSSSGFLIEKATFILVWNPSALPGYGYNGVKLSLGDDGPTNLVQIGYCGRQDTNSPVVDSCDITAALQAVVTGDVSKQILMQTAGQSQSRIYRASIDILWKLPYSGQN